MLLLLRATTATPNTISYPVVYANTTGVLLDENGLAILDENGQPITDGTNGIFPFAVRVNMAIVYPLVSNVPTVFPFTVTLLSQQTVVYPLVSNVPTVFPFTVTTSGTTTIEYPLVTNVPVVFAPSITTSGTATIVFPLVDSTPVVFPFSVELIPIAFGTIVYPLVSNIPVVFAFAVIGTADILYRFEPPTTNSVPVDVSDWEARQQGVIDPLRQYQRRVGRLPRGRSVLRLGGTYTTMDIPTQTQIDASTEYYAGGHIYFVDAATATALTAAGYLVAGFTGTAVEFYGSGVYDDGSYE